MRKHIHLMNDIPNNFVTRWVVKYLNKRMARSGSVYGLRIRYRKPKSGGYKFGGGVDKDNSKRFSLYLDNVNRMNRMRRENYKLNKEYDAVMNDE